MSPVIPPPPTVPLKSDGYFYVEIAPGLRWIEARYYADTFRPLLSFSDFLAWLDLLNFPTITIGKTILVDMCRIEALFSGLSRVGSTNHVVGQTVNNEEWNEAFLGACIMELHAMKLSDGLDRSKEIRRRLKAATLHAQNCLRAKGAADLFRNKLPTIPSTGTPTPSPSSAESSSPKPE